jgi:hypothetical protein
MKNSYAYTMDQEVLDVLEAYARITDPNLRGFIVELMETLAEQSELEEDEGNTLQEEQ